MVFQKMSIIELIKASKDRDCDHIGSLCRKCYTLSAVKEQFLRPLTVHRITIPIVGFTSDPRLLQVHNHLCERPWRVLNSYLYICRQTVSITLHIVSSIQRTLGEGEPICHVSFVQPEEALYDLKGKDLKGYQYIYVLSCLYIWIFTFQIENDEYFFSESEEIEIDIEGPRLKLASTRIT